MQGHHSLWANSVPQGEIEDDATATAGGTRIGPFPTVGHWWPTFVGYWCRQCENILIFQ